VIFSLIPYSFCQNCTYTDADGYTYDFSSIRNYQMDYFIVTPSWKVWLNFCGPLVSQLCGSGVSGCMQWDPSTPTGKASIGMENTVVFSGESGSITATFTGGKSGRSEVINFFCDPTVGVGVPFYVNEGPLLTYNFQWNTSFACPLACSQDKDCNDCANSGCKWCLDSNSCIWVEDTSCMNFITNSEYCPETKCSLFSDSCSDCLEHNDECDWCLDSQSCIQIKDAQSCGNVFNDPTYCPSSSSVVIN